MDELPDEVLQQIFSTLTARDLLHATCKTPSNSLSEVCSYSVATVLNGLSMMQGLAHPGDRPCWESKPGGMLGASTGGPLPLI